MKLTRKYYPDFSEPGAGRRLKYVHPNGWLIWSVERDWSARGLGGLTADPKKSWEVKKQLTSGRKTKNFRTLKEAREWCDEHTDWGIE